MKKGDIHPVMLGPYEVAEALIVEIDGDNAILEIPATRIVMGIHSSLGDLPQDPNAKERVLLGPQDTDPNSARAALEAAGIELDEDDDFAPGEVIEGEVSLKDMVFKDDV